MKMGEFENALVGGCDEMTQNSFTITSRMGFWKRKPIDSLQLINDPHRGSISGEGASFFFLDTRQYPGTYAVVKGVTTFRKPSSLDSLRNKIQEFLAYHKMTMEDIGFCLLGISGDPETDKYYTELIKCFRTPPPFGYFKHLCGEYHTATSYGLSVAAMILKRQTAPEIVKIYHSENPDEIKNLLIYNHFRGLNHSFTLLTRP
jgi:hypothetical protein